MTLDPFDGVHRAMYIEGRKVLGDFVRVYQALVFRGAIVKRVISSEQPHKHWLVEQFDPATTQVEARLFVNALLSQDYELTGNPYLAEVDVDEWGAIWSAKESPRSAIQRTEQVASVVGLPSPVELSWPSPVARPVGPLTVVDTMWHVTAWLAAEDNKQGNVLARMTPVAARVPRGVAATEAVVPFPAPVVPSLADTVLRPNGEKHYVRVFDGVRDVEILQRARESRLFVLLTSPAGVGKTSWVEAAFAESGIETLSGTSDTEVADFVGAYVQREGGLFVWVDGPLLRAMEKGIPLFVDDIALIDPKVLSVLYPAMDGRREVVVTSNPERGTVKAADGFYCTAAMNPDAPGARMSEALVSRFALQLEVFTDYSLAGTLGVSAKAVTAAENLEVKRRSGEVSWAPQLRELLAFRDISSVFCEDWALASLVQSAPAFDRPTVKSVLERTFAKKISPVCD